MLRTLVAVSTAVVDTAIHAPLIVGASFVSPDATETLARSWSRIMLRGLGVDLQVEGREKLDPRAISGTKAILPKGFNAIHGGQVRLRIGDPIPTTGMGIEKRDELTEMLRARVAAMLEGA